MSGRFSVTSGKTKNISESIVRFLPFRFVSASDSDVVHGSLLALLARSEQRCNVCNGDFEDGRLVPHKGKPYHKQCYDELFADKCAGCGKALKVSPMGLEPVLSTKRSQTASFALP